MPPSSEAASPREPPARTARTPGSTRRTLSRSYSSNVDVASSQHNAAVVIEFGSAYTRIGLSGESTPRHVIETTELPLPSAGCPPSSAGAAPSEKKWEGILYPLLCRILTDLLLIKPRSRRVLVVEPFVSPAPFRTALCRVLLHWMNVPCVLFVSGGMVTVPHALGMNGSLVVDVGRWEGRVVCVSGGRYITNTFQAVPCGYENLANALMVQHNLASPPIAIPTLDDANAILQQCSNSPVFASGDGDGAIKCLFPSTGQIGTINVSVIEDCLHDMFFNASNPESLIHALFSSVLACPVDLRVEMLRNVSIVGGGVIGIPNFERRLLKSIFAFFGPSNDGEKLYGTTAKFRALGPAIKKQGPLGIIHPLPFAPQLMSWIGGSIMGTLGMSDERWVYRQSFLEQDEQSKDGVEKSDVGASRIYDFLSVSR